VYSHPTAPLAAPVIAREKIVTIVTSVTLPMGSETKCVTMFLTLKTNSDDRAPFD
jgi:hypothetical protein